MLRFYGCNTVIQAGNSRHSERGITFLITAPPNRERKSKSRESHWLCINRYTRNTKIEAEKEKQNQRNKITLLGFYGCNKVYQADNHRHSERGMNYSSNHRNGKTLTDITRTGKEGCEGENHPSKMLQTP